MFKRISLIFLLSLLLTQPYPQDCFASAYTIQTGLFKKRSNALKQVELLKKTSPDLKPFIVRKGELFFVKSGQYRSREKALSALKIIRKISKDAYIEEIDITDESRDREKDTSEQKARTTLEAALFSVRKDILEGKYSNAIEKIKMELEKYAESHELHGWYGTALLKRGDPEAALPWFRKAIFLDETIPDYHNGAGYCLLATGRLYEALDEFSRALKLNPDYADALAGMGYVYVSLGMKDDALAVYNRLKKINREMADLLFRRIILM